jgi:hypothetical protein
MNNNYIVFTNDQVIYKFMKTHFKGETRLINIEDIKKDGGNIKSCIITFDEIKESYVVAGNNVPNRKNLRDILVKYCPGSCSSDDQTSAEDCDKCEDIDNLCDEVIKHIIGN